MANAPSDETTPQPLLEAEIERGGLPEPAEPVHVEAEDRRDQELTLAVVPSEVPDDPSLDDPSLYFNRELSWIDFNSRVLFQAMDERVPLLERVRFVAITANNLDEFYRKRIGGLKRQLGAGVRALSPDGRTLIVANSDPERAIWMTYPVRADGSVGEGRLLFDATAWVREGRPGLPDGMAVDAEGNVFATGPGGVLVFSAAGAYLGTLETEKATANVTFGGPDGPTLFLTSSDRLLRVPVAARGLGL